MRKTSRFDAPFQNSICMTIVIHSYRSYLILQRGIKVYPGDGGCNRRLPHAKWHVQSGLGLLDLVYLCDNIYELTASLTRTASTV